MGLTKFPNGVSTDNDGVLYTEIADISTAASSWTAALPFNVQITGAYVVQETAVTVASSVITFEIGGTPITGMSVTVTAGGAAGQAFASTTPTGAYTLTAGTAVEVVTDGGSTTASLGRVAISYKRV